MFADAPALFKQLFTSRVKAYSALILSFAFLHPASPVQAQQDTDNGPLQLEQKQVPESRLQVQMSYAPLVKQTAPAVVNIYTKSIKRQQRSAMFDDPIMKFFFGQGRSLGMPQERVQRSLGSGVVVRENGIIITNNHVVEGADEITVVMSNRKEYDAKLVLADPRTDLAILKIDTGGDPLQILQLEDSDSIEVGDIVLAIGNPFGVGQSVSSGIVSATSRTRKGINDLGFFIQTDAAVNPGNSGGALVGLDGKLIGINTSIISRSGASNGIGFAVPANMVRTVIRAALHEGELARPWLGVKGQDLTSALANALALDRAGGVLVNEIYPGSPADKADLKNGDVILAVDQKEVLDQGALNYRVATKEKDETIKLVLWREGRITYADVTLSMPPEDPPRAITELDGRHIFQGVTVLNLSPKANEELQIDVFKKGVMVAAVGRSTPTRRYGFVRPRDVFLSMNGEVINTVSDLTEALNRDLSDYTYDINRGGQRLRCQVAIREGRLAGSRCSKLAR